MNYRSNNPVVSALTESEARVARVNYESNRSILCLLRLPGSTLLYLFLAIVGLRYPSSTLRKLPRSPRSIFLLPQSLLGFHPVTKLPNGLGRCPRLGRLSTPERFWIFSSSLRMRNTFPTGTIFFTLVLGIDPFGTGFSPSG
jgi:hypothetical protein